MTPRALLNTCLLLNAVGSLSCARSAEPSGGTGTGGTTGISCSSDFQCNGGQDGGSQDGGSQSGLACVASVCVPYARSIANLAIEIAPAPVPGSNAAFTELAAANGSTMSLMLSADPAFGLAISFTPPTTVPATASVILTAPSSIPGRPGLTFQANLQPGATEAMLTVPAGVLGRHAGISLLPIAPADQTSPPFAFDVEVPSSPPAHLMLELPAVSYAISGTLVDAFNTGKGSFYARAFETNQDQPGDLISTKPLTTAPGNFVMILPAQNGSQPITASPISVELTPTGAADPWFRFDPFMLGGASTDLGSIALPVYSTVNQFQVSAHGVDDQTQAQVIVGGASVRAYTKMDGGDPRGSTMFLRDATTDAMGTANLTLIPGDSRTPRLYALSVVPPAGSVWAGYCKTDVPVSWNGTTAPPALLVDVPLSRRPVVTGTVLSAIGVPVGNVVVTATRGPLPTVPCLPGPASTTVTADARGMFTLPLDAGTYQLDYDPPDGSSSPRLTEFDVPISANMARPVHLLTPALVEGDVHDAINGPLPNATIRIFEPRCASAAGCKLPPILRAQTQSNDKGHFRAVVPAPPAN